MKTFRSLTILIFSLLAVTVVADEVQDARQELKNRGIKKIVLIKRYTSSAVNYYTEHVSGFAFPGGQLCIVDLETDQVQDLCPSLQGGIFERFDLHFDATKIVFAWKVSWEAGYRLYEVGVDGTGLRRILPPPPDEARLVKQYGNYYHHGTDDMSPCYLPGGGIAFVSTRCQFGLPCDAPDILTTTVLYRCDPDGLNLRKLSNSAACESAPICLEDGRILYTRWEYLDKGSVAVNALWTMRPDGTGPSELFGNHPLLPPTLIYGREIPGQSGHFVVTGAPHSASGAFGSLYCLDTNQKNQTLPSFLPLTPFVEVSGEIGWRFRQEDGTWQEDRAGRGPLFKEAWPVADDLFLVSHKPEGESWNTQNGYGIYLLDRQKKIRLVYRDPEISCWNPVPLLARPTPYILSSAQDNWLASQNLAQLIVRDVSYGLENLPQGTVKYLRILEQVPRPWSARQPDLDDEFDQQHVVITKGTHLALKVQHGIVPVEEDGSANFLVPAGANLFLQALDENYLALQTERTYIHTMPGEVRSCLGCHETSRTTPRFGEQSLPLALMRSPQIPGPQPGEISGRRVLDYVTDVQPVWDKHCVRCHNDVVAQGNLDLSGKRTRLFNASYENLISNPYDFGITSRRLVGSIVSENHPKTGNFEALPAGSLGARTSVLAAMLVPDKIVLADPLDRQRAHRLVQSHQEVVMTPEEFLKITNWLDTNCQYYGSYFGRRHIRFEGRRDFRPKPDFRGKIVNYGQEEKLP